MKEDMNYIGNKFYDVDLPELNEEVLFCRPSYCDEKKDIYFSGYIYDGKYGLNLVNSIIGGTEPIVDGIKWARFNKPETENNKGYAIAYTDENGKGFLKDIPNIIDINQDDIEHKVIEFMEKGYGSITVFNYIKPCTFKYDWNYVNAHKVSWLING